MAGVHSDEMVAIKRPVGPSFQESAMEQAGRKSIRLESLSSPSSAPPETVTPTRKNELACTLQHSPQDSKMKVIRSRDFTGDRPWAALDIANMQGTTTRLHWTDQPYKWHVNDGEEVFAVLDGTVIMHYREAGLEKLVKLETGDVFFAGVGCEHVAHPVGEARILVVEREGSV